ncbi:MAG: peptidase S1 [Hyphomonas sp.]|nr:trypsin-like serine protease [Hyphomonas sp.]MBB41313.1 peptidase S1 [Hyphomonas sp.]|tara:strand:+ start:1811 stop:3007 length:1197 start_codon:yes stop_codon:yes gene_type:complete
MKRHLLAGAALMALTALPACDAVRLPGINPSGQETAAAAPATGMTQSDSQVLAAEPETDAADMGETPTVDRDAVAPQAPDDMRVAPESLIDETAAPAPEASDPDAAEIESSGLTLAELNAVPCGLPADAPPTPTVGAVAGATQTEDAAVGAEAVNALAASLANFPGIVKLEPVKPAEGGMIATGHCGAVRIADHWLATAAHCVDEPFDQLRIIGTAENLRSPLAHTTEGDLAICHGGYAGTANGYANDLALIRLSDAEVEALGDVPVARYGATDKPLAPANYPTGDMAGWGLTHFGGKLSNSLLSASIRITGTGPATIYVASQAGAGPCVGDSGGPLYVTEADGSKTAIGILSVVEQNRETGQFCAGDYNGRYTNLQGYTGWLSDVMALCDSDEVACR